MPAIAASPTTAMRAASQSGESPKSVRAATRSVLRRAISRPSSEKRKVGPIASRCTSSSGATRSVKAAASTPSPPTMAPPPGMIATRCTPARMGVRTKGAIVTQSGRMVPASQRGSPWLARSSSAVATPR